MIIVYDYIINIDFYSKKLYNISTITIKRKCKEMNGNGNFLVNNNSNREALIGVETGQNEESYTPKISSDLFRESNHNSLRDFFNEYEDEKRINATIDFIKTMRNYMSEQKYMDMSFGHDDEGTISIIMESSSSKSAPNDIEVVRFNPLDLSELDLESLDKYDLIMQNKEHYTGKDVQVKYLDSGNQAFITVTTAADDKIRYNLDSRKGNSILKQSYDGFLEESYICDVRHLDTILEWDHRPIEDRLRSEERSRESEKRAYYNL